MFVVVVLWFVNFDDVVVDLMDFVDFLVIFVDDGVNYIIGDVDLLSYRFIGCVIRVSCLWIVRIGVGLGFNMFGVFGMGWYVGGGRFVIFSSLSISKVYWDCGVRMCCLRISVILRCVIVGLGWYVVGFRVWMVVVVVVVLIKVFVGGLRDVWDDSYVICDGSRIVVVGSVCRGSSFVKVFVELF